jgi:serine/threonine protein kinase
MTSETDRLATTAILPSGPFPQQFGRYTVLERLGQGGMGTVYRAHDDVLDLDVALKVPHPELMEEEIHRDRFLHEARAAVRLVHPNLCRVLDVGVCQGTHYLAMDFIPGQPLSRSGRRSPAEAARLIQTLAVALAYAHAQGVIHRDLKPSNILMTPDAGLSQTVTLGAAAQSPDVERPVITDFGLALRINSQDKRLTQPGATPGTPYYMAPEQFQPTLGQPGPGVDIYSLGVILYELLTGEVPFPAHDLYTLMDQVVHQPPSPPSRRIAGLDPAFEAACLRALAKRPEDRFRTMEEFAAALAGETPSLLSRSAIAVPHRVTVSRDRIRFVFVGYGERAPAQTARRDRLFLDVGNDLRAGVIDHHHQASASGSTAGLVLRLPDLVAGAVNPLRKPDDPFTVVLHEQPDLDGLAAAYLSIAYLTTGAFPPGAEVLARYVDRVDDGSLGMSLANPFSLYAAFKCLANRLLRHSWNSNQERWQELVRRGLEVVDHVVRMVAEKHVSLPGVDAFATPGLFTDEDRADVLRDINRYHAKLQDPWCKAQQATLHLPGQYGGTVEVESLRVRDVQNVDDPERCMFFKDWARTDAKSCPNGKGFVALSVFMSEGPGHVRRCILSVTPESGASLRGLGELLDAAESERRWQVFGVDDRVTDPSTGDARVPRPGYTNADPWYDGRAQGYTIVDAPRGGTLLTADEIEAIFLKFGGHDTPP